MFKSIFLSFVLIFGITLPINTQEDEITATETVTVVNVEVPVRVIYKGKPIDHLKKTDFKLYEGGEEQEINGFYLKRKKISLQKPPTKTEKGEDMT